MLGMKQHTTLTNWISDTRVQVILPHPKLPLLFSVPEVFLTGRTDHQQPLCQTTHAGAQFPYAIRGLSCHLHGSLSDNGPIIGTPAGGIDFDSPMIIPGSPVGVT